MPDASYLPQNVQNLYGTQSAVTDPAYSDGIVPKKFWVGAGGADGDANGRPDAPFATITFALTKCASGRGDTIFVGPGSYAENVNVNVANVAIIGTGNRHTGITQIIGSPTSATTTATVYVGSGYLSGFRLANVELDTNGITKPALWLVTNDSANTPAASSANYRGLIENVAIRSNDPDVAILLEGATLCDFRRLYINGTPIGIAFTGSASNNPDDLLFEDVIFTNSFSTTVTAAVATVAGQTTTGARTTIAARNLTNVKFRGVEFDDNGSTNWINLQASSTCTNVKFSGCTFTKAPTNGTNGVATLPSNVVVLGHGTSGLVSLKG